MQALKISRLTTALFWLNLKMVAALVAYMITTISLDSFGVNGHEGYHWVLIYLVTFGPFILWFIIKALLSRLILR